MTYRRSGEGMRILFVGHARTYDRAKAYYFVPEKLLNGFSRLGHAVFAFSDRAAARASSPFRSRKLGAGAANRLLLEAVDGFRPDFILLGACEGIRDETLREIRRRLPAIRMAYENVDSLTQPGNREKIERKVGIVDGIFVTTGDPELQSLATARTFIDFMPNPLDVAVDEGRAFAAPTHRYDLFFAGGIVRDSPDHRLAVLEAVRRELADLRLGLFGEVGDGGWLFGREYVDTLARSRIGLSLDRENRYRLYASDRMAQYLGNGLLTAIPAGKGFERFFTREEVLFFRDADDLVRQVRGALADDQAWRRRAEAAHAKAHSLFACEKIAAYILRRCHADGRLANPWLTGTAPSAAGADDRLAEAPLLARH